MTKENINEQNMQKTKLQQRIKRELNNPENIEMFNKTRNLERLNDDMQYKISKL